MYNLLTELDAVDEKLMEAPLMEPRKFRLAVGDLMRVKREERTVAQCWRLHDGPPLFVAAGMSEAAGFVVAVKLYSSHCEAQAVARCNHCQDDC